jgi:hypothetical protein
VAPDRFWLSFTLSLALATDAGEWVRALFNPINDDVVKDAWGWLGIAMICLGVVGLILFGR